MRQRIAPSKIRMTHDDLPPVIARKVAPNDSTRAGSLLGALREACIAMLSAIAMLNVLLGYV